MKNKVLLLAALVGLFSNVASAWASPEARSEGRRDGVFECWCRVVMPVRKARCLAPIGGCEQLFPTETKSYDYRVGYDEGCQYGRLIADQQLIQGLENRCDKPDARENLRKYRPETVTPVPAESSPHIIVDGAPSTGSAK